MDTITYLQQVASPTLDRIMLVVTDLGDAQAYIALLVILYLAVSPVWGRRVGIALMVSFYLNFHLKGIVDTPRPFERDPAVARGDEAVATAPGAGFPSGHAQGAATFWGYLAWQVRRPWVWVLAAVVVALVSVSRLYLGVHVPVDILGGWAVAAAVVAAALDRAVAERAAARRAPVSAAAPVVVAVAAEPLERSAVPVAVRAVPASRRSSGVKNSRTCRRRRSAVSRSPAVTAR